MVRLSLDLPDMAWHLRELLRQVPRGRVTTYGALAAALGDAVAARWVGHFLLHHDHEDTCPCHRVVRSDGQLGQYIASVAAKRQRLAMEGVEALGDAVDLARFGFERFRGDRPLERLRQWQEAVASAVSLRGPRRMPRLVAGLDVSYPSEDRGVGAYALVELSSRRLLWKITVTEDIRFPYISSYLGFRELPIHFRLIEAARAAGQIADVLMVDGSGILHPRRAGIATQLGVTVEIPTIGVTKKLLCGEVNLEGLGPADSRPVVHDGQILGVALRPRLTSLRPIFVCPGHRIGVAAAKRMARKLLCGHPLPEPIFWADRLSRAEGRRLR